MALDMTTSTRDVGGVYQLMLASTAYAADEIDGE